MHPFNVLLLLQWFIVRYKSRSRKMFIKNLFKHLYPSAHLGLSQASKILCKLHSHALLLPRQKFSFRVLNESCTDKIANGSACFYVRYAEKLKVIRLNLFAFKKAFNSVLSASVKRKSIIALLKLIRKTP